MNCEFVLSLLFIISCLFFFALTLEERDERQK